MDSITCGGVQPMTTIPSATYFFSKISGGMFAPPRHKVAPPLHCCIEVRIGHGRVLLQQQKAASDMVVHG